ncbi:MAG: FoF1 ATP synthase subunit gamma [bacterium]|nr:FoF1 ATP synthase subunit gamma [bacterium]
MSISLKKLKKEREQTQVLHDVGETIQRITAIHRVRIERQHERVKEFRESLLRFSEDGLPLRIVYPQIPKALQKPLLMVIGPEKGLVGDLHRELASALDKRMAWRSYQKVLVAGSRLCGFLKSTGDLEFSAYPALSDRPTREELLEHVKAILEGRRKGEWNMVELLYPKYDSITSYHIEEKTILPFEIRPDFQKQALAGRTYFIEPSFDRIITRLEEMLYQAQLYEMFLEARYVELSQRLLASTRATENAKRILKTLRRKYLREVRSRTTRSINEIFTGRKAYEVKSGKSTVALEWVV